METTVEKGTRENPYTFEEYEALLEAGNWQGGYVEDDEGGVVYTLNDVGCSASGGYSGYGSSDYGSWGSDWWGSDWWGSAWWGSDPFAPWENGDNTGNGNTGGGAHTGGGNPGGNNTNPGGGGGGGGHNTEQSTPKSRALDIINKFEKRTSTGVYPNVNKAKFIQDLKKQINTPALVRQGDNGTCGIAAICKYLLECMPDKYAEAAISLYETGKYDRWGLKVCEASKTGSDAQATAIDTTALDCIVQGAFRNTYNETADYNPFTDGSGWLSITWPTEINSFFENQLQKNCDSSTYIHLTDSYERLSEIDYSKKFVIALIGYTDGNDNFEEGGIPRHYVQILGTTNNHTIKYWQMGQEQPFESHTTKVWGLYIIDR